MVWQNQSKHRLMLQQMSIVVTSPEIVYRDKGRSNSKDYTHRGGVCHYPCPVSDMHRTLPPFPLFRYGNRTYS